MAQWDQRKREVGSSVSYQGMQVQGLTLSASERSQRVLLSPVISPWGTSLYSWTCSSLHLSFLLFPGSPNTQGSPSNPLSISLAGEH